MLNLLVERLREVGRGLVAADVDVRGARDEGPVGEGHGLDGRDAAAPLRAARPRRARERALERPRERRPRGPDLPRDGLADVLGVAPGVQRLAQGAALRRRHDGDDVGAQRPVLEAEPPRRLVLRGLERAVGARVDVVREGAPAAPLERGRRVRVGLLADPEDLVQEAVGLRAVVVAPRGRARAPRGVVVVVVVVGLGPQRDVVGHLGLERAGHAARLGRQRRRDGLRVAAARRDDVRHQVPRDRAARGDGREHFGQVRPLVVGVVAQRHEGLLEGAVEVAREVVGVRRAAAGLFDAFHLRRDVDGRRRDYRVGREEGGRCHHLLDDRRAPRLHVEREGRGRR
mmetsp:Transcript_1464/g.4836  ORF Transcript_1464/g.4836 Transcript_1464/m.4836 type:complete len:343 (-) Transcript_1464:1434-2462(-)